MRNPVRIVAASALALALAWVIWTGRSGEVEEKKAPAAKTVWRNQQCVDCHRDAAGEWASSRHGVTFVDLKVQAAFQHFGFDRQCESCHAPEPTLGLDEDQAPKLRAADRNSGVNCLSCHLDQQGQVAGSRDRPDAPCRPKADRLLTDSASCGKCHTAVFEDWGKSRYAKEGKTCQSCHMPALAEGSKRKSHACLGGHDPALVRSGAKMEARLVGEVVQVEVTNHATGHNFPGERHNRMLLVQVIERTESGETVLARQALIKGVTPFRGETSAERIKPDETFTVEFPAAPGAAVAEVKLLYKLFPFTADRDALTVHERTVALPSKKSRPDVDAEEPPFDVNSKTSKKSIGEHESSPKKKNP